MPDNNMPIIDAWANPAVKELFARVPEIERLFRQSGREPHPGNRRHGG